MINIIKNIEKTQGSKNVAIESIYSKK